MFIRRYKPNHWYEFIPGSTMRGKMRDDMQCGGNPDLVRCKLLPVFHYLKLLVTFQSLFPRRIIPSLSGTNQFESRLRIRSQNQLP